MGATPALPPPAGSAARRAQDAFREYLTHHEEVGATYGGGRRYDRALAVIGASPGAVSPPSEDATPALELPAAAQKRPPAGMPTVRPSVRRARDLPVPQELLEKTADTAMLVAEPSGATSFDIVFKDELFRELACRVTVGEGGVEAVFRVHDDNARRLLEAESGRLRARLVERGLRVQAVRVEVGE